MSMNFDDVQGNIGGSSGLGTGIALGSLLNRRDDDRNSQWIWAVIVFIIFVVIALVFLAFMKDDRKKDYVGTDYAAMIAPILATKCADNNGYKYDHDEHMEIKSQINHSEDRRMIEGVKAEVGSLGLFMQKTASDNEMKNLEQFGEIKGKLGMLELGLAQVLQVQNNEAIITGVINRLMCKPC